VLKRLVRRPMKHLPRPSHEAAPQAIVVRRQLVHASLHRHLMSQTDLCRLQDGHRAADDAHRSPCLMAAHLELCVFMRTYVVAANG
jgi:hypothetical protein